MLKSNSNEKLTEKEIKEIQDLQTKINTLLDGNFIHDPRSRNNTSD
jgi:hypothetical protein